MRPRHCAYVLTSDPVYPLKIDKCENKVKSVPFDCVMEIRPLHGGLNAFHEPSQDRDRGKEFLRGAFNSIAQLCYDYANHCFCLHKFLRPVLPSLPPCVILLLFCVCDVNMFSGVNIDFDIVWMSFLLLHY